ncbi:hypothetical protein P4S73_22895 [Paraglaciecola sp. Hal342]
MAIISQSVQAFSDLIQQQPDNQNYATILVILLKDDQQTLAELASAYPLIAQELSNQQQTLAWNEENGLIGFLAWITHMFKTSTFFLKLVFIGARKGQTILFRILDGQRYFLGLAHDWQQYRFGVRLNYQKTRSNSPNVGDAFGSGLLNNAYSGLTGTNELGISGFLKRQNTDSNLLAEVSYWRAATFATFCAHRQGLGVRFWGIQRLPWPYFGNG